MAKAMRHLGRIWRGRFLHARRLLLAASVAGTVVCANPYEFALRAADHAQLVAPPAVVHAVVDERQGAVVNADVSENVGASGVMQVVGKQPEARKTTPSRALFLADSNPSQPGRTTEPRPSEIRPVAGGLIDNWFSGQKSKGGQTAKKEHEDGRKATALPPPDPSTVNWQGIPFHQPKRSPEKAQANAGEPIRDLQRRSASSAPTSTANLRRALPAPSQTSDDNDRPVGSQLIPSRPISATTRRPDAALAPIPPVARLSSRNLAPIDTPVPKANRVSLDELSSSNSSRRSSRQSIDPPDAVAETPVIEEKATVPSRPIAMSESSPMPNLSRRELIPLDTKSSAQPLSPAAVASKAEQGSEDDLEAVEEIPMIPKSFKTSDEVAVKTPAASPKTEKSLENVVDSWNSVGSGVTPRVAKAEVGPGTTAAAPPAIAPIASVAAAAGVPLATVPPAATAPAAIAASPATAEALPVTETKPEKTEAAAAPTKQLASSELPGVRVITDGPAEIMIRELTQYEVRVENRGAFDATGIVVRSSLPGWAEVQGSNASIGTIKTVESSGQPQLQWTIEKLPAGVVERLFVRVRAIKSGVFDVATDWTMMPQKHVAKITVREPKLAIMIDGPDEIVFGRSEKYRVRVMNPGDGDASNVVFTLAPDSKSPQTQTIGTIPAGKEANFEIELTAREMGELNIGGMAVADREVKSDANKTITIAAARVEAELTGPSLKYQNSDATYHLYVTNTGKANCEQMQAELRLPPGMTYISGVPNAVVANDRLKWKVDTLQPGAVREYDVICRLDRTGDMLMTFSCSGSAGGEANVAIETRVEAIADLVLSISDPIAPAPVDAEVFYEIMINNRGSKAAEDVRIVAQFSHGIEPMRVEGHKGEIVTGQVLFDPISRIEPGSSVRLKVIAKADRAGDHRFRTEVRHGEMSHAAEESTMYMTAPAERVSRRSTDK